MYFPQGSRFNHSRRWKLAASSPSRIVAWKAHIHVQVYRLLVGGLEHFYFPINIGNVIIPIDELIFFRGVALAHQPDWSLTDDFHGFPLIFRSWAWNEKNTLYVSLLHEAASSTMDFADFAQTLDLQMGMARWIQMAQHHPRKLGISFGVMVLGLLMSLGWVHAYANLPT